MMERHADWLITRGVHGLIVNGSLGEASTLSFGEKIETLRAVARAAAGRVPVLATIAENSTAEGCRLARESAAAGADGLMVLPGLRYVADARESAHHFRSIAAQSDLPLMIYNNPLAYGTDVTPAQFAALAAEERFVAIKESSGDIRRIAEIRRVTGKRYRLFCGVDDLALEALLMGADGWVAGLVTAFPAETVAIYEAVRAGRLDEARRLYHWFLPLLRLDVSAKLVQNIKLVECKVLESSEHVRAPRLPLMGEERREVERLIEDALRTRPWLEA
jgi:4-hydroxy-tetrahydrodipicolinate synthase